MSGVRKSAYRQPVTAKGLAAIEAGTLTWLDEDMYNNLNTGLLEQYFEEKNLKESFEVSHWSIGKIMIGILIGSVFSGVTAYIGLKIGLAVSAAWYVAYLLGMALKWSPSEVNISTSATTGATHASTGFIFTFPAIFLLSSEFKPEYHVNGGPLLSGVDVFQLAFIGIVASMFAGFLGVMYFIIFRRVWLVEDPLPMPGFEATLKMLDITADVNTGAADAAKESLQTVGLWTVLTMGFMFLIDYPLFWKENLTIADKIAVTASGDSWGLASIYSERWIHQPSELQDGHAVANGLTFFKESNPFSYTFLGVELSPTLFAVGWFMRMRVAFLVNLGSFVAWFFLIPLVVALNVPIFDGIDESTGAPVYTALQDMGGPVQWYAYKSIIRTIAIGAILGGGLLGLLKMAPTFISIFGDIGKAFGGEKGQEYIEGKGWYEWPLYHIPMFMLLSFFTMIIIFWAGGFPVQAAIVFALVLILTTFLLGAIAVRVMGETGIEPVSGTSFIVLLMLLGLFLGYGDFFGLAKEEAILIALVGTTVFGSAISMSGTVVADYKNSLYIGNRPYHISKGN
ncbi:MAG: OPT/YSL family transporter, partial [Candidatus Thermoplasmatota archaeon]|nr:OPT/YSL family transporter [Candidatus Thermoplasmatota archaeon]